MQGHALAQPQTSDPRPEANDRSRRLVPEDTRWRNGAILDLLDVRGTNSADRDFDQNVAGSNARDWEGLQSKIVCATENDRAHRAGH